jgi:hypothetical protein
MHSCALERQVHRVTVPGHWHQRNAGVLQYGPRHLNATAETVLVEPVVQIGPYGRKGRSQARSTPSHPPPQFFLSHLAGKETQPRARYSPAYQTLPWP